MLNSNINNFKISLLFLIAVIYLMCASGLPWVEADIQLTVAKNLVFNHSLSTVEKQWGNAVQGRNDQWYDCHGIANVLVMAPIASLEIFLNKNIYKFDVKQFISFLGALTGVFVNALACLVFFSILLLFGRPIKACLYTTLCLAFLTIVFPYASTNYEGNLNMLFVLNSLYFLLSYFKKNKLFYLIPSAMFAGLAVNTREFSLIFLFYICVFIFYMALKRKNVKILIIFFASILPFLILWGYYNWLRAGLFFITAMAKKVLITGEFHGRVPEGSMIAGLKGLLLSKGGSIFLYSPILILSMFGWKKFYRDRKKECFFILSIVVLFLLANAKMFEWFGFWGWGPRYTLTITPLMMLPLGYWFSVEDLQSKIRKYAFIFIASFSLLIQLVGTLTNWHARLGYVLSGKDTKLILFTAKYSQWWDSVKTLYINLWNLLFSSFLHLENLGYSPSISKDSLYMSRTIFTWWNRVIFMGINPVWVVVYLFLSILVTFCLLIYIRHFIQNHT